MKNFEIKIARSIGRIARKYRFNNKHRVGAYMIWTSLKRVEFWPEWVKDRYRNGKCIPRTHKSERRSTKQKI